MSEFSRNTLSSLKVGGLSNSQIKTFRDLIVWQKAVDLAKESYILADKLPKKELYALSDQLRRAAISVPSNIAEGRHRGTSKEFGHFLSIAHGSLAELETQLILAHLLYKLDITKADTILVEVRRMLIALIRKLNKS